MCEPWKITFFGWLLELPFLKKIKKKNFYGGEEVENWPAARPFPRGILERSESHLSGLETWSSSPMAARQLAISAVPVRRPQLQGPWESEKGLGQQSSEVQSSLKQALQVWVVLALLRTVRGIACWESHRKRNGQSTLGKEDIWLGQRFEIGNVEIIGWDQSRKALNSSQGIPTLTCRHSVTFGEFWAQEK